MPNKKINEKNSRRSSLARYSSCARFISEMIMTTVPKRMPVIPRASRTCGGLRIFTSRPYAACHQLSNGAEVIMHTPPQAHRNAPMGPRNPHFETEYARKGEFFWKVVERIR